MTKPDRIRDPGTDTEREAKKKRNLSPSPSGEELESGPPACEPGDRGALQHARPEMGMRGVGDGDKDESVTETDGARVDEMTKTGGAVEEAGDELSSFTPKSPISKPYIPNERKDPAAYPETLAAFKEARIKYRAKLDHRYHLFNFPHKGNLESSCLIEHTHLLPIRETAQRVVLHAAKSIIRLSSSVDGKPLADCCGLWIKWDEKSKTGIVLTTAHLIRSKHPTENHWKGRDEYNTKADVSVHLLDDKTAKGHYLYHQEHYDLALFKVIGVDGPIQLPSFSDSVRCGQDVFRLGRDDHMNLRITHGMVEHWNPISNERHHYMYFFQQKKDYISHKRNDDYLSRKNNDDYLCDDDGGSVIGLDGKVVGLVNKHVNGCFVPSCILVKCLDLWDKFGCIPRLHLGMKFNSIRLLDPIHVEQLWRVYKIENGLIVQEVSKESHAEKLGICFGDVIERFNGECISTTVELENMLLGRCWDHLDQGNHLNEDIDVSIQVFHIEERLRRTINLTVNVSDGGEIVISRTYAITATEGTSASVHCSQNVADDPFLPRRPLTWEEEDDLYYYSSSL
uniref:Uncharacterized protein n=1 Tax=Avena sativa TaxID=4498 RepID=A0ACD6A026_AVESA